VTIGLGEGTSILVVNDDHATRLSCTDTEIWGFKDFVKNLLMCCRLGGNVRVCKKSGENVRAREVFGGTSRENDRGNVRLPMIICFKMCF